MAGPKKTTWTVDQHRAIETRGSVLVSAAAGSGKTAVLAERCAYFVCDAPKRCSVSRLLVVTFTEPAAEEMKSRIRQALRNRVIQRPGDRSLVRELDLVEQAHVSTVHGFCARLLRQNFHLIGLDPAFEVMDADEATLLRLEVADELFQRRYETDKNGDFQRLIDCYGAGDGDDEQLMHQVIAAHELLQSLEDPDAWIARARNDWAEATTKPLPSSTLGNELLKQIAQRLDELLRQCDDAHAALAAMSAAVVDYAKQLKELSAAIRHWQNVFQQHGLDMLVSEFADFTQSMPQAPRVKGDALDKELAKSLLDGVKDAIKKGPLRELLAFTTQEWQQGLAQTVASAQVFLSLVEDFSRAYSDAKKPSRAVDFSDLERFSLQVLKNNPPLVRSLRDQFEHVLVDEYQDINGIQDAILKLVSREDKSANLFSVGDVKQSIFRFRLADPERFQAREKELGDQVIHLQENFRSRAPLLDAINATFERLMTQAAAEIDYDQSHKLKPGRSYPAKSSLPSFTGGPIELHLLPKELASDDDAIETDDDPDLDRAEYEALLVARQIERLMGRDGSPRMNVCKFDSTGQSQHVPIEYGDIVILLRAMRNKADIFADALRAHQIPVHNEGGGGFFDAVEVRDMLCLLQVLDNQKQDIPLAAVLRSPLAAIPDADDALAQIRAQYPNQPQPIAFHEAVRRYAAEQNDDLAKRLTAFLSQISDWRDLANKRPVAELLWTIYEQSGYLTYCAGLNDGQQRVANLIYLHERAAQFGTFLRQGLHRFLRFLSQLRQEKDLGRPSTSTGSQQAVRIMSIHRAKGLEFPVVIVPDLGKLHNLSDTKKAILLDRAGGLGMDVVDEQRMIRYPSLSSVLVRERLLRQTLAEELRLLYVAMTRAKEHLILIGTCADSQLEKWRQQWQTHRAPLPPDRLLAGKCALDWLGPAAVMTASANPAAFEVISHTPDQIRTWPRGHRDRQSTSPQQQTMAAMQPLIPPPPQSSVAENVKQRFQAVYPFAQFSALPASASVTSLAKAGDKTNALSEKTDAPAERKLDLPQFFAAADPKATDIGTATHLALQHWDFSTGSDSTEIARQIGLMVKKKLMSDAQAKLVNHSAIQWFLNQELGQRLTKNHQFLMREIPFALAASPDGTASQPPGDPLDLIMIRGRIDLLLPTEDGVAIVDYKTDNITPQQVPQRAKAYAGQMRLYAQAIGKITQRKIRSSYLVFLSAKHVEEIHFQD